MPFKDVYGNVDVLQRKMCLCFYCFLSVEICLLFLAVMLTILKKTEDEEIFNVSYRHISGQVPLVHGHITSKSLTDLYLY